MAAPQFAFGADALRLAASPKPQELIHKSLIEEGQLRCSPPAASSCSPVCPWLSPRPFEIPAPPANLDTALHWRSVGPFTGGRATTVAGIPDQPNVFYMGTAGGGVWETDDYGANWRSISDKGIKTGAIGAMAVAPSNPKIIYVGTGDSAPRNTVLTGDGMYKSTDGGKTWAFIGLGDTHIISWILVDPTNPDVVYAAALGHLFAPNAGPRRIQDHRRRQDLEEDPLRQ